MRYVSKNCETFTIRNPLNGQSKHLEVASKRYGISSLRRPSRPSGPVYVCYIASDDNEAVKSATHESKPSSLSSNSRQVCSCMPANQRLVAIRHFSKIPRHQPRPRCQPCRLGTLSPLHIASTENDIIDACYVCVKVGGMATMHRRI